MAEHQIKYCKKHGDTEHALYKSGNRERWKCLKCQTEATQKRRDKLKVMAVAYKGGVCQCCKYNKYIGALEFHHINPDEKDFGISVKGYTRSWENNKKELDKCVLVCSNCHKEIHAGLTLCPQEIISDESAAQKAAEVFEKSYIERQNC